jgi:hypothetical protein
MLLAAGLIAAAGCNKEEFSRYPSVSVPEFTSDDYIRDLSDRNPEVVYNAICNLGGSAKDFGKALSEENANPASEKYRTAQTVYRKIGALLESCDPQVVAASLRFLQLFSTDYKPKAELIEPISRIQSGNPVAQFEQVTALSELVTNTTRLPAPLLRRLLVSRSWIVSHSTYQLINQLADEPLRRELMQRYRASADEKEKLLLLTAFGHQPGTEETTLLKEAALATSPKIRRAATGLLANNLKTVGVFSWLVDRYPQLRTEERTLVFNTCAGSDSELATDLMCRFLAQGYVPDNDFLQELNKFLEEEPDKRPAYVARVEQAVRAAPGSAARWQTLRETSEKASARFAVMQGEYAPLSKAFAETTRALLTKHGVSASDQEKFLEPIINLNAIKNR